ncbi:MAG: NAD(+) synthase [Chloroflexota bacterium]
MQLTTLATCNLNQWALDFEGNLERIVESIRVAKAHGARYRLGPELEISGYGCQDAFLEGDTLRHSWECLAQILDSDLTDDILCDIGMPVMHQNARYNCRVLVLNRRILLIRPKMILADDGNYREPRWFAAWQQPRTITEHHLPRLIRAITGQNSVPFGDAAVATRDTVLASEMCEELFAPQSPHTYLGLDGVEIITNGSGSHHTLRKLQRRVALICEASAKSGGVYVYANQQGCDGDRLYFDGSALIAVNGRILAQASQFSPRDVEVITATIDLEDVRAYRGSIGSLQVQTSHAQPVPRVIADFDLTHKLSLPPTPPIDVVYHTPEEEIAYGPACWLWDYLRRSGTSGFFCHYPVVRTVRPSRRRSASCARWSSAKCEPETRRCSPMHAVWQAITSTSQPRRPNLPTAFYTCYMGTQNSSKETRARAKELAAQIGAHHLDINIDTVVESVVNLFVWVTEQKPRFQVHGGTRAENLALQNIQARLRMVLSYLFAQLLPWVRGRSGTLLVLGTSNVDEALRGYMTKYDCSSADINPIGSVSKVDLRRFLRWAAANKGYTALNDVIDAPPTAELEPITADYAQQDETDMGMTYVELSRFGYLRKVERCGPLNMFEKLVYEWDHLPPMEVAAKVKHFFYYYAINRHKMTVLTPSYHAESYSPDDNRFDLRQFLYNVRWTWQFRQIDNLATQLQTATETRNEG